MESKIKHISKDENAIELESGIKVVAVTDSIKGCKYCCFSDFHSEVCKQRLCTSSMRKDKTPKFFKLQE